MFKKRRNFFWLSALLLPTQFALADHAKNASVSSTLAAPAARVIQHRSTVQAPGSAARAAAKRGKGRRAPYDFKLPHLEHELVRNEALLGAPLAKPGMSFDDVQKENAGGLHWSTMDSRPGLAYRLNKDQDLKLRVGRHGAIVGVAVSF